MVDETGARSVIESVRSPVHTDWAGLKSKLKPVRSLLFW